MSRRLVVAAGLSVCGTTWAAPVEGWDWRARARVQLSHDHFEGVYTRSGGTQRASYLRRANVQALAESPQGIQATLGLQADSDGAWTVDNAHLTWPLRGGAAAPMSIRLGRFDPDFGLEPSGSSSWTVGIERSAIWDLAPDITDGTEAFGGQWQATGAPWHTSASFQDRRDHRSAAVRVAWAPIHAPGRVLHLGLSAASSQGWRGPGSVRTRLGVRGVSEHPDGQRSSLATAGDYAGDRAWAVEGLVIRGAWSVQAEWLRRDLRPAVPGIAARIATGHYVQLAWTLTGQSRSYALDGARLRSPRTDASGTTPWEVFVRRDTLSVRNALSARVHAIGVNVYPSARWRLSANVLEARAGQALDAGDRPGRALSLRTQWVY